MQPAGSLGGTITRSQMSLPYVVRIAHFTESSGGGQGPTKTWSYRAGYVECDAFPLRDELFLLQTGTTNIAELVFHFHYGTTINVGDRIVMQKPDNLAGVTGGWFEVINRLAPSDILAYIRCYAKAANKPPGLS